jgi:hypothetical protein
MIPTALLNAFGTVDLEHICYLRFAFINRGQARWLSMGMIKRRKSCERQYWSRSGEFT